MAREWNWILIFENTTFEIVAKSASLALDTAVATLVNPGKLLECKRGLQHYA